MKRFVFGTFLAVSVVALVGAIVGCSSSTAADEGGVPEECLKDPMLSICQMPDDEPDVGPGTQDDL